MGDAVGGGIIAESFYLAVFILWLERPTRKKVPSFDIVPQIKGGRIGRANDGFIENIDLQVLNIHANFFHCPHKLWLGSNFSSFGNGPRP